jgi:succinoglycan biosynthesis transport protein ExoP
VFDASISRDPEMRESRGSFDADQYLRYLRRRLRFILIVCAVAAVLALGISLVLPKQFTATASILIDPPAGNDPRSAISVSPVYLESLRGYELFASSDTLFQRALEKFHLREADSAQTIESLKRRILKVTKVRDTRILEIAVTLPDPKQAQAVAQFLADETISLNRNANVQNDADLLADGQKRVEDGRKLLDQAQLKWREFSAREPFESMRADLEALSSARERLGRDLMDSRAELAEFSAQTGDPRLPGIRARVGSLEKQDTDLARQIQAKATVLSEHEARAAELQEKLRAAQLSYDAAAARMREVEAAAGSRGERLRVMDPGVVPERPSSPNVALNVALALAVVLASCLIYLTLTFHQVES